MNRIFLFFIFLLLSSRISYATHAMGAELTYRYLGNSEYEITYTFYRDCSGIPAPILIDLVIKNQSGIVNTVNIFPTPASPFAIQTTCSSVTTTCNGGIYLGAEKWIYCDTITL